MDIEDNVPSHVAIIMDGNGRWAQRRDQNRCAGHKAGAATVRRVVEMAVKRKIRYLTLFAFSSENWKRPEFEVQTLMRLFSDTLRSETLRLKANNVKTRIVGDPSRFSAALQQAIREVQEQTVECTGLVLQIAVNYGGRWDLIESIRALAKECTSDLLIPELISEKMLTNHLVVTEDVDLLIRTGGEHRISNFLLWQSAYSEVFFSDVLWPDFDEREFEVALRFYQECAPHKIR